MAILPSCRKPLPKEMFPALLRRAHTLKGVAGNLSMRDLFARVSEVVECLRGGDIGAAAEKMPAVEASYRKVADALSAEG